MPFLVTPHHTSDALWAGLLVLTCIRLSCIVETFSGRVAASLLTAMDLPELITQQPWQVAGYGADA